MHSIKLIKKNPEFFSKKLADRNFKIKLEYLLNLDKSNRDLIEKREKLEQEKKIISQKKDEKMFSKSKDLTIKIESLIQEQSEIKAEIENILSSVPNIALDDVPIGKDDKSNLLVKKVGEIKKFTFSPKSHFEIGKKLNLMDFDLATKTSGARFVFLRNDLALLERAISNFMLDIHTKKFGYQEISPPLIVNQSTMFGTGQLPKFESDQFEIKLDDQGTRKFLIPTAEVILTNIVRESFLSINDLPLRFVACTACFRKEAGSYGKDTKGMMRQHQFYKVELVSIVNPEDCITELNRMTECAQKILKELKLPYRIVQLSTGDMGFSAEKTFDLEVWIPSENQYREISSCSSCGQFQARRMKAKYKNKKNESDFLGTLNGSGLAIGRTLIAIMENFQEKDGSITIPEALIPYMNGKKTIG
jgi:seryl-tRNA synthetase